MLEVGARHAGGVVQRESTGTYTNKDVNTSLGVCQYKGCAAPSQGPERNCKFCREHTPALPKFRKRRKLVYGDEASPSTATSIKSRLGPGPRQAHGASNDDGWSASSTGRGEASGEVPWHPMSERRTETPEGGSLANAKDLQRCWHTGCAYSTAVSSPVCASHGPGDEPCAQSNTSRTCVGQAASLPGKGVGSVSVQEDEAQPVAETNSEDGGACSSQFGSLQAPVEQIDGGGCSPRQRPRVASLESDLAGLLSERGVHGSRCIDASCAGLTSKTKDSCAKRRSGCGQGAQDACVEGSIIGQSTASLVPSPRQLARDRESGAGAVEDAPHPDKVKQREGSANNLLKPYHTKKVR